MLLRPRQRLFVERSVRALGEHSNTLGVAPTGCHAPGTPILMFDGSIRAVETIDVGDRLVGPDSCPRTVLELHRGRDAMVEVRPIKGEPFVVNESHILALVKTSEGSCGTHASAMPGGTLVDISVAELRRRSANFRHLHKLYRVGVDFPAAPEPPIDPYFLGLLLGDGCLVGGGVSITTPDAEIVEGVHHEAARLGLNIRLEQCPDNEANTYHFVTPRGQPNPLLDQLRALRLLGLRSAEKSVPRLYKTGSRPTRAAILAGLLDTDGHMHRGCFELCLASCKLADDIAFLARSLGLRALRGAKPVNGITYYRVHIAGDMTGLPLRVVRKTPAPRGQKKDVLRTGFTLHDVGQGEYFGFTVDGDHRYLLGDFTVTHNSGKTIMLSAVAGDLVGGGAAKACVLAHRDELTEQNRTKFRRVHPAISTSVVDAKEKSWAGQVTFAMVPTLARPANLEAMPVLDLLVIDEAHHAAADTYRRIIDRARERNPDLRLYGVTATPNRGDRKGLRAVFSNVADQIRIGELVAAGHLVPPRTFVIDVGVQDQLSRVRRTADDFDMAEVDAIMNRSPVTDAVIRHWREKAGDRQTVVFCSTVDHATNVTAAFCDAGIDAALVTGEMPEKERRSVLARYAAGGCQVVVNVAVLTEGWDHPPTSCVVLLRPSSFKCTMIQMVGRGLRTVDPQEHPGIVKTDCVVLDFGTSSLLHGSLEQDVDLIGREPDGEAPTKTCPDCGAIVPLGVPECPLCGYLFSAAGAGGGGQLGDFAMSEIDLLKRSSFQWCDLFGDDAALVANGFNAWGGVFFLDGRWYAVGGGRGNNPRLLGIGERTICLAAADDWLNENETDESAHKTRSWLKQPPTEKQLAYLPAEYRQDFGLTRYQASALLTFRFNRTGIRALVFAAEQAGLGRAA
ncbi:MAG: DEAD/DEAH box helicase family protein [Rhodospirillales bacterium]|nr:DEAD/DEAH box helicase family protein [Rhodospirillales bacterium]